MNHSPHPTIARRAPLSLVLLAAIVASACGDEELRPLLPCNDLAIRVPRPLGMSGQVDLLFMIDNSSGMREEQVTLAVEIPRLITSLTSGTSPGDSRFAAVLDLRVGVITSDMGTGGFAISTCTEPNFGDDGILRRAGAGGLCTGIPAGLPPYLGFRPGDGGDVVSFSADIACIANIGTTGCGLEQPLDATLKALTPSSSPVRFVNGTSGHSDGANEGFLRTGSLLVIVELTGEDDCSAANPDIFNRDSRTFTDPDMSLRCWRYGDPSVGALHPAQRYVDGLLALREPSGLIFASIVGVPVDLGAGVGESVNFRALIGPEPEEDGSCSDPSGCRDPRMVEAPDPAMPSQLRPSCDVPDRGTAYPPVRIVRVAEDLEAAGAGVVVSSICQGSYAGAIDAILEKVDEVLSVVCLPLPLPLDEEERPRCEVRELLPLEGEITRCDQIASRGRVFRELDTETGRQLCTVCQTDGSGNVVGSNPECQALGSNAGWFYETGGRRACPDRSQQALLFTEGAEFTAGAVASLKCAAAAPEGPATATLGTPCEDNPAICDEATFGWPLSCDPASHTCAFECESTVECEAGGLAGYVCYDADGDGRSNCVNPTCSL